MIGVRAALDALSCSEVADYLGAGASADAFTTSAVPDVRRTGQTVCESKGL
jgi:hypothetical protein